MKKVISIVLNNFKNDSRVLKENISLHDNGYDVKVIALHEEPLHEFEKSNNISVHRIKLKSRSWSKHKVIQMLKYFEFSIRVIMRYKNADIFHCNDLSALPIGVFIKLFFNSKAKIVYDAHEYETEMNGLGKIEKKFRKTFENLLIRYADKVITVSDAIANEYSRLYNIDKPALVLNTPAYTSIQKKNIFRETFNIEKEQKIFLYQGGLSVGRGIEILLETFQSLSTEISKNSKKHPVLIFMGYGVLEEKIRTHVKNCNNIYFHPAVDPNVLLNYTSSADFGFSTIQDTCLSYRYCLPNKMFEYIMSEVPVIVSNLTEMKRLVIDYNIGLVLENNTPESLKETINNAMTLNCEEYSKNVQKVKAIYNWEQQEKILLKVYKDLYEN